MAPATSRGVKRSGSSKKEDSVKKVKGNNAKSRPVESSSEDISESEDEEVSHSDEESEDELDQLDQSGSEEDADDQDEDEEDDFDEENSTNTVADPNKQSSKEQHAEQKKLLAERKLQRKAGSEVQNIKAIWEKLRVKTPPMPKERRDKLANEIWDLSKDIIKDLVMKHDASRVVQTLVKYSPKDRREAITKSLKGNFYALATSAYGKYLLVKLLHYGSKESRELILNELHGKLRKLMRHREGAYVVEDLYVLYSTAKQKKQMIREFWGSEYAVFKEAGEGKSIEDICNESEEKKTLISRNLIGTITASVEKGSTGFQILHAAMRDYVSIADAKQTSELIELLHEQFAELVHTQEGSEVACTLIARANAKERKQILRALKAHAAALIKNDYGNIVLITIFMTVDDTVLVGKTFVSEYASIMHELITDKFSRRPLLYLLNGLDPHFFSPSVKKELLSYEEKSKLTSKKDQTQRRLEILKAFLPLFFNSIIEHPFESMGENIGSQFVSEVLLNEDIETDQREAALSAVVESFKGPLSDESHLIHRPFSARLLRTLIQGGRWNAAEKKIVKVDAKCQLGFPFAAKLIEGLFGEDSELALKSWIKSEGSFVVVALFESATEEGAKNKALKEFLKSVKAQKKVVKAEADEGNKGAQLLLKLEKW